MNAGVWETLGELIHVAAVALHPTAFLPAAGDLALHVSKDGNEMMTELHLRSEFLPDLIQLDLGEVGPDTQNVREVRNAQGGLRAHAPLMTPYLSG